MTVSTEGVPALPAQDFIPGLTRNFVLFDCAEFELEGVIRVEVEAYSPEHAIHRYHEGEYHDFDYTESEPAETDLVLSDGEGWRLHPESGVVVDDLVGCWEEADLDVQVEIDPNLLEELI